MLRSMRSLGSVVVALLGACGPEKMTSTEDTGGSSGSSGTSSTTAGEPTSAAATTGSSGAEGTGTGEGTSSGEGTSTTGVNGVCRDLPDDAGMACLGKMDRESCQTTELDPSIGSCLWIPFFKAELLADGCSFGPPRGACNFIPCSEEGCATMTPCGPEGFGGAFVVGQDGSVSVGFADWCLAPPAPAQACVFDFEGGLVEGPPECACLCDPEFPAP